MKVKVTVVTEESAPRDQALVQRIITAAHLYFLEQTHPDDLQVHEITVMPHPDDGQGFTVTAADGGRCTVHVWPGGEEGT